MPTPQIATAPDTSVCVPRTISVSVTPRVAPAPPSSPAFSSEHPESRARIAPQKAIVTIDFMANPFLRAHPGETRLRRPGPALGPHRCIGQPRLPVGAVSQMGKSSVDSRNASPVDAPKEYHCCNRREQTMPTGPWPSPTFAAGRPTFLARPRPAAPGSELATQRLNTSRRSGSRTSRAPPCASASGWVSVRRPPDRAVGRSGGIS